MSSASTSIRVRLLSFGPLKAVFGPEGTGRDIPAGLTLASLLAQLTAESLIDPAALASAAIAVNHEYATPDRPLVDGDEIAILPPVSGGAPELIALTREPMDTPAILAAIKAGPDGAICLFDGIVRDNTRGRQTLHLDYEAYEEMALRQLHLLRAEALKLYAVREVAIHHRLGRLTVGETSVLIVVASAHRGAAFDACRFVIDTLKKTVPIWKREQFADGALWADGEPFPQEIVGTPS
jgi:molybdopterin synthase catalytic subunit